LSASLNDTLSIVHDTIEETQRIYRHLHPSILDDLGIEVAVRSLCREFNEIYSQIKIDGFVKSPKIPFSVIPAKAGIQSFQAVADHLDSGFHRSDDFLRDRQN